MEQIRARLREKRGVDYTEQQIRELAAVKLEKFLDPRGVRSDLLEQFRKARPEYSQPELPKYAFEEQTLYESHRGSLRWIRRLLRPVLKLFFNPNPLIQALHIQSRLNTMNADREARREAARHQFDQLQYEVMHNLVIEATRTGIEIKNLKMRVESLTSRLEFNERRARALEGVVVYKPSGEEAAVSQLEPRVAQGFSPVAQGFSPALQSREAAPQVTTPAVPEGPGQRSRRRRRRRGRRGAGPAATIIGAPQGASDVAAAPEAAAAHDETAEVIEQAMATESLAHEPIERSGPATGSGPATDDGFDGPDGEQ